MENKEKAIEISDGYDYTFDKRERDASYYSALEMAEWKDREFKEYLEKKKAEVDINTGKPLVGSGLFIAKDCMLCLINEIIDELFNK